MNFDILNQSIEHLSKDRKLNALIDKYDRPNFENNDNYFNALSKSIIYQQLSGKVAKVIYNRFLDLFKNRTPDLEIIISLKDSELRKIGLSKQKTDYIKGLSKYFYKEGKSIDFPSLTNQEISKELIKIKGIGQWTVDMFLMFTIFRTDILPVADLGIKKGFKKLFNLKAFPSEKVMINKSKKWQPYRTIACCYLWKLVDDTDVW
jgi:DNA-3-methyladenine glycosylase II